MEGAEAIGKIIPPGAAAVFDAVARPAPYEVLCVINAIVASTSTATQNEFAHPYMLINKETINRFYSPTFAPSVQYALARHVDKLKVKGKEKDPAKQV